MAQLPAGVANGSIPRRVGSASRPWCKSVSRDLSGDSAGRVGDGHRRARRALRGHRGRSGSRCWRSQETDVFCTASAGLIDDEGTAALPTGSLAEGLVHGVGARGAISPGGVRESESPQIAVGRGGASSMPPQQRNSIEMSAPVRVETDQRPAASTPRGPVHSPRRPDSSPPRGVRKLRAGRLTQDRLSRRPLYGHDQPASGRQVE